MLTHDLSLLPLRSVRITMKRLSRCADLRAACDSSTALIYNSLLFRFPVPIDNTSSPKVSGGDDKYRVTAGWRLCWVDFVVLGPLSA